MQGVNVVTYTELADGSIFPKCTLHRVKVKRYWFQRREYEFRV